MFNPVPFGVRELLFTTRDPLFRGVNFLSADRDGLHRDRHFLSLYGYELFCTR